MTDQWTVQFLARQIEMMRLAYQQGCEAAMRKLECAGGNPEDFVGAEAQHLDTGTIFVTVEDTKNRRSVRLVFSVTVEDVRGQTQSDGVRVADGGAGAATSDPQHGDQPSGV